MSDIQVQNKRFYNKNKLGITINYYDANAGTDDLERTPANILPTQTDTDRLMGQFNFYNVTFLINIGNPLPKGFSGSGIHDNNFFFSQYVR